MDSGDHDGRLLAAFLAGDLDPARERRWDEHLLACEQCWRAVREDRAGRRAAQRLRQPAPIGLADRVGLAVEVAAGRAGQRPARPAVRSRRGRHGHRPHRALAATRALAAAGALAAVAATLVLVLVPGGHQAGSVPAAVAAVARYAQAILPPVGNQHPYLGGRAAPAEVGRQVTITVGGQRVVLRTWRLGSAEAVVAVSARPFPMPAHAQGVPGRMAWWVRLGRLGLYCLNGATSELVAAPVPDAELAALAARLPPA